MATVASWHVAWSRKRDIMADGGGGARIAGIAGIAPQHRARGGAQHEKSRQSAPRWKVAASRRIGASALHSRLAPRSILKRRLHARKAGYMASDKRGEKGGSGVNVEKHQRHMALDRGAGVAQRPAKRQRDSGNK